VHVSAPQPIIERGELLLLLNVFMLDKWKFMKLPSGTENACACSIDFLSSFLTSLTIKEKSFISKAALKWNLAHPASPLNERARNYETFVWKAANTKKMETILIPRKQHKNYAQFEAQLKWQHKKALFMPFAP